jgi:hypothetical protein
MSPTCAIDSWRGTELTRWSAERLWKEGSAQEFVSDRILAGLLIQAIFDIRLSLGTSMS